MLQNFFFNKLKNYDLVRNNLIYLVLNVRLTVHVPIISLQQDKIMERKLNKFKENCSVNKLKVHLQLNKMSSELGRKKTYKM